MHCHGILPALLCLAPLLHSQDAALFISTITPSEVDVGGPGFDLTVDGWGFVQGSVVNWSGTPLPTTFRRAERLIAAVPGNLLVTSNPFNITVTNPGGQASNPSVFMVQPIITGITPHSVPLGS